MHKAIYYLIKSAFASADNDLEFPSGEIEIVVPGIGIDNVNQLFVRIIEIFSLFVGVMSFVAFLIAGFSYLTSGAGSEGTEKSKKIMTYSFLGLLIAAVSFTLLFTIQNLFK